MNKVYRVIGGIVLCGSLMVLNVFPQKNVNHDYPRIGVLQWGGGSPEWLAKFDLVITPPPESTLVRAARAINPDAYYFVTRDWMAGATFIPPTHDFSVIPDEWRIENQSGTYLCYACNYYGGGQYMLDFTEFCERYTGTVGGYSVYNERYNTALPRVFNSEINWSIYDGVNSDGTWDYPHGSYSTGIDLDRNGLNDYTESGKGPEWIRQVWQRGHDSTYQRWRNLWGNNQKLITYWTIGTTPMGRGLVNGVGWERMFMNQPYDFTSWRNLISQWEQNTRLPRINWITSAIDWMYLNGQDAYRPSDAPPATRKKDYFRFMRWTLGWALLNDVYYMIEDTEHFYFLYYDEFDVKLGYPAGSAQRLANGCWVRFFDDGVSIVNPTNSTLTVTDGDLAGLSGYAGPYYRFKGNQDPLWNNGTAFTSVELISTRYITSQYIGDGIILVKKPTTVVSDIIVDNAYSGTSPGSPTAVLTGFTWDQNGSRSHSNPTWNTGPRTDNNELWHRSHYAPAGSGSATAVFMPAINVSGSYRVYEWHGWCGTSPTSFVEASNVPCRIVHANGTTDVTIDQSRNAGQWNLIGTFSFRAGGNASVTITNDANGYVIADAFKFEYVEESASGAQEDDPEPSDFKLLGNYPNPFNPTTKIEYIIPVDARVTLKIFNVLGQEIKVLYDGDQSAGVKNVEWNAIDKNGNDVPSGFYYYRFEGVAYSQREHYVKVGKMCLIR